MLAGAGLTEVFFRLVGASAAVKPLIEMLGHSSLVPRIRLKPGRGGDMYLLIDVHLKTGGPVHRKGLPLWAPGRLPCGLAVRFGPGQRDVGKV